MLELLAAVLKALLYASLLTFSGVVVAAATLRSPQSCDAFVAQVARFAAFAAIPTALCVVLILILRLGEFDTATLSVVFSSNTGAALFMQFAGVVLLLVFVEDESARGVRLLAAALAIGSIAFNGHAASVGPFEGFFVLAHASAAAWWMGSLLLLREACIRGDGSETAGILRRFSEQAIAIVGGLVVAGFLLIYVLVPLDSLPALSDYEKNLAIKLSIVVLLFAIVGYNKFRLTPRILRSDSGAVLALKKMVEIEIAVIAIVLAVTAILTTYTSPT